MASQPVPQKRPSGLMVVLAFGVAVALTVALVVVAVVARGGSDSPDTVATPVVDLEGIPQDGAVLGEPAANVTLIEYADIQCPACRAFELDVLPAVVDEYVRTGKMSMEFRGFPFLGPDSLEGEQYLLAAAQQNRLWQLAEALYRHQGAENSDWLTEELIREVAAEIPGLDVDKLVADASTGELAAEAEQARDDAEAAGIPGTPTLLIAIGDEEPYAISFATLDDLRAALDDALTG